MARVPSSLKAESAVRPIREVARKQSKPAPVCRYCGSPDIRPSNRRNSLDVLLSCLFLVPFRCRLCRVRFYRFWKPGIYEVPEPEVGPPAGPVLVMPPRRMVPEMLSAEVPPIAPRRVEPVPVDPLPPQPPSLTRHTVLILEADVSIRRLLSRLLERRGYTTVELSNVGELATNIAQHGPALVVLDLASNRASSLLDLAITHPHLRILALSESAAVQMPANCLSLPKPFALDRFVDAVDRLLATPRP